MYLLVSGAENSDKFSSDKKEIYCKNRKVFRKLEEESKIWSAGSSLGNWTHRRLGDPILPEKLYRSAGNVPPSPIAHPPRNSSPWNSGLLSSQKSWLPRRPQTAQTGLARRWPPRNWTLWPQRWVSTLSRWGVQRSVCGSDLQIWVWKPCSVVP